MLWSNPKTYFEQEDTPSKNSPVGVLMVKVLAKNPGMTFDAARQEANRLLDRAAGGRVYKTPRVYSKEEQAANTARMQAISSRSKPVQAAA